MLPSDTTGDTAARPREWFATTHWSVVLAAGAQTSPAAQQALERLCRVYWRPLRAYVQHRGFSPQDTEDLTQQFFVRFLEKQIYRKADRSRGRFRSFLLSALKNFLVSEHRRAAAQKRGGGQQALSLDAEPVHEGEAGYEPSDNRTADWHYERTWALTVLEHVRARLGSEYDDQGKGERFGQLEKFLSGEEDERTYAQAAGRLGVAVGTIKSDIHRLKRRYREILREEIAHTVSTPSEIDDELRELITVLGQTGPTMNR